MKIKKLWKRIIFIFSVMISAVVLLYGIAVIYLHSADIVILDDFPARGTFKEYEAAMSAAQYGGYYEEHDRYMSEAFADQPWFGYARYDIYTQTMTIYLNEDTEEHREAVNAYIAKNEFGDVLIDEEELWLLADYIVRLEDVIRAEAGFFKRFYLKYILGLMD